MLPREELERVSDEYYDKYCRPHLGETSAPTLN